LRKRQETAPGVPPGGEPEVRDRQFVVALARGLDVLRAFKPGDGALGNQEIATRTDLPKPTVSRLTHTLCKLGYLNYSQTTGRYALGTPVLSLGFACLAGMDVRQVARPLMQELAEYSGVSVGLGGRDRLSMVYLESCRPNTAVTLRLDVGSRIPIATTSMGRAFLAALPEGERGYLMEHIRTREKNRWPQILDGIEKAIDDVKARGFSLSMGEWTPDIRAVGVPYSPRGVSPILAFNCGGPAYLLDRSRLEQDLGPRLVEMVRKVDASIAQY
jgi:DNA-binding IclR family transcriptional regulator